MVSRVAARPRSTSLDRPAQLAPYVGSKRSMPVVLNWLRDRIRGLLGEYREPFAGTGSVFLHLASSWSEPRVVWLNDARRGVASLWAGSGSTPRSCAGR